MPNHSDNETLIKELEELAQLPEMNPGPVLRIDTDGKIILANSSAKRLFNKQTLVGENWRDLCPGMDEEQWSEVMSCSSNHNFEADIAGRCFLFIHVCPANSENYFVFGSDITEIKIIEREMEAQQENLANMARFPDMNPGPVLRCKLDGEIILTNRAAIKVFGRNLNGETWQFVCPKMDEAIWGHISTCGEITHHEVAVDQQVFVFTHVLDPNTSFIFIFGTDITEQKLTEKSLQQSEKMATLGTLAAGVAHELNNPAAATKRAAEYLKGKLSDLEKAHIALGQIKLNEKETQLVHELENKAISASSQYNQLDSMTRSDLEADIEDWLDDQSITNDNDIAPQLVDLGFNEETLDALLAEHDSENLAIILNWVALIFPVYTLLTEISEGTNRISEIVVAMKNYSFLGQAQILDVDLHQGIDNTLVILRNKMKVGVKVALDYAPDIPRIMAYGSELNQVWTNLLDNAIDAMNGQGTIKIRTKKVEEMVQIEIEDNGEGIPTQSIDHVFEPFYTTKSVGKGTGLGLATSYGIIVEKHKGTMTVTSEPGQTIFRIVLPINLDKQ